MTKSKKTLASGEQIEVIKIPGSISMDSALEKSFSESEKKPKELDEHGHLIRPEKDPEWY